MRAEPLMVRWQRYSNAGDPRDCWLWKSSIASNGYGQIWGGGKTLLAHRVSYELHVGPVPDGMFVCHTCDVPRCVNPGHLFVGTPLDNVVDMTSKGRRGTRDRLTAAQKANVNFLRLAGAENLQCAEWFGVAKTITSRAFTRSR